jgi:tetratricopeptide (TPR) repeat protein
MYWTKSNAYQLISQEGDRQLGGDDFDAVLVEAIVGELNKLGRDAAPKDDEDFIRIVSAAEDLKRSLDSQDALEVPLGRLLKITDGGCIRVPTESLTNALKRSTESTINLALKTARMASDERPEAILALGGTAQSPFVQEALQRSLGIPVIDSAEDSVAIGAVLFGQRLPQSEWDRAERQMPMGRSTAGSTQVRSDIARGAQANPQTAAPIAQDKWAQNFVPLLDAAQAEYDAGKIASAIAAFENAMDALGRFKGDLYRKAAAAFQGEGRTAQALDLLREGNQRDSRNRFIAVDFAETCYREAVQARSIHKPQVTVELTSQGASSLRHLPARESNNAGLLAALLHLQGIAFVDQGKLAQAVPVIAESVTLDPRNGAYTKDLERVRKMLRELGPNDRCPCQSGLKYKKCCGRTR